MPLPTLTPAEIAQLQKEQTKAEAAAETFTAQIAAQNARAAELLVADGGFKKFFDYYNDDIIGKYDAERKNLNGQYIASPIVEADVVSTASLAGGRTQPALPATDIIRISQFDGTPLIIDINNEQEHILRQAELEDAVQNGYGSFTQSLTLTTTTSLTALSTTLAVSDSAVALTLAVNDVFVLANLGDLAVVKILTITPGMGGPPYTAVLGIQIIVPPTGTIASGAIPDEFSGFTNGERTTKTASDTDLQPLMDYFVDQIELKANSRITNINNQLTALTSNQDPDGVAQITTATTNANTSKTFLTNYLTTTDISNTGLSSLATERATRSSQITTRLAQILASYTGQTENYFNRRYDLANDRANTSRGSLRLQKAAVQNSAQSATYASTLTAQAASIGNLLP